MVETLPIKIFNALRYGYTPVMASVTMFFVLLAALIFGLIGRLCGPAAAHGRAHSRKPQFLKNRHRRHFEREA